MNEAEVAEFGRSFQRFLEAVSQFVIPEAGAPLKATLESHLGREADQLPVVADRFEPFEHVNVQAAVDALLEGRAFELVGLLGDQHGFMSFADLVQNSQHRGVSVGAVDYVSLADGPDSTRLCVKAGLYLAHIDEDRVAILLRGPVDHSPHQAVSVEMLAGERGIAERVVAELRRLSVERSVFRNQVLSFAAGPFGEPTVGPIAFHPRPRLARTEVVLPEETCMAIDDHVFGIASHRARLRASGQHLKRGLLLHGPPGTGKTLTSRYVIGRLTDHTVVVLSGAALQCIGAAATLAPAVEMSTGVVTGSLRAGSWTRVVYGWGYFSVDYGISIADSGGRDRAYTAPIPWPAADGQRLEVQGTTDIPCSQARTSTAARP